MEQLPAMVHAPVLLPALFDYAATFTWALSGALIAARRGYVGVGVLAIAMASATGGGLLRDGLLLSTVPQFLRNPTYLVLVGVAALVILFLGKLIDRIHLVSPLVHFIDAVGAGSYAVVGVSRAIDAHLPPAAIVIVGVVNAVGGGVLRDILMRRVPDLFKPGLPLGATSLLGAGLFALLVLEAGMTRPGAGFVTIGVVFLLNTVMLHYHIKSRPLADFRDYWEDRG